MNSRSSIASIKEPLEFMIKMFTLSLNKRLRYNYNMVIQQKQIQKYKRTCVHKGHNRVNTKISTSHNLQGFRCQFRDQLHSNPSPRHCAPAASLWITWYQTGLLWVPIQDIVTKTSVTFWSFFISAWWHWCVVASLFPLQHHTVSSQNVCLLVEFSPWRWVSQQSCNNPEIVHLLIL